MPLPRSPLVQALVDGKVYLVAAQLEMVNAGLIAAIVVDNHLATFCSVLARGHAHEPWRLVPSRYHRCQVSPVRTRIIPLTMSPRVVAWSRSAPVEDRRWPARRPDS
jgi:hypothetical protein